MEADNELKARAAARLGRVLRGKYRLDAVLGAGGMAVVYAATHRNQKRFAVKLLHPELSLRSDIRTRFLREGYAANSLNHAGAVSILDDDLDEDGSAFLVMELLEGVSVDNLLDGRSHKLPVEAVLDLAAQLLETLAVAHEKHVVHRDIKPANLFLQTDGALKVLDFGIARVKAVTAEGSTTNTGTMLGTPAFMAPEQAGGTPSEVGGATDVWGVGATMFTLISGQLVHVGETPTQMAIQAATKPARSLATVSPDAPAQVVAVVDRALAFSKADRWESAQAMREAVGQARMAVFGAPVGRASLEVLVAEHVTRSTNMKAQASTVAARDAELAPTLPQQATPAFTPVSALAQSIGRDGGTTAEPVSTSGRAVTRPSEAPGTPRRAWLVIGAVVVAAAAAGGAVAMRVRASPAPSPTAASVAPPSSASPEAPSAAPSAVSAKLGISPAAATVEVDGTAVPVAAGLVDLSGPAGSMHMVHIVSGPREGTFPVLLTATGAVPQKLELGGAPATAPGRPDVAPPTRPTSTPARPTATSSATPTATASQGSVSRTME